MIADAMAIGGMMFGLMEMETLPLEFDKKLWYGTIERVTVYEDKRVVFRFKDGKEVETSL